MSFVRYGSSFRGMMRFDVGSSAAKLGKKTTAAFFVRGLRKRTGETHRILLERQETL